MKIKVLIVSPFMQNARILACEETGEAIFVDPGDEAEKIIAKAEEMGVTPKYILATHGHIDHIAGARDVQRKYDIPFYIHEADLLFVEGLPLQAQNFGIAFSEKPKITRYIQEGEVYRFGKCEGKVLYIPGHSPGSVGFLFGKDLIGGDALFAGSIGRTDLPGASFEVLEKSIREKLYTLPDDTVVHSGHGPNTTIGQEKATNPFVKVR